MTEGSSPSPTRRSKRRSTEELRRAILDSARELFEERGYRATTTRDIASRANVAEPLLFRHFASKANLFRLTIVEPFSAEVQRLAASFDPREPALRFLTALYRLLRRERGKVQALLSADTFDTEEKDTSPSPLQPIFAPLERVTGGDVDHYGFQHVDVELTTAICVGSLL